MKYLKILIVIVLVFILTACSNNKRDSKLIGTWHCDYYGVKSTYVFNTNGTGSQKITVEGKSSKRNYTYKTENDKILITFDDDKEYEFPYGYRFDSNNLVLKDSTDEEFICMKK